MSTKNISQVQKQVQRHIHFHEKSIDLLKDIISADLDDECTVDSLNVLAYNVVYMLIGVTCLHVSVLDAMYGEKDWIKVAYLLDKYHPGVLYVQGVTEMLILIQTIKKSKKL